MTPARFYNKTASVTILTILLCILGLPPGVRAADTTIVLNSRGVAPVDLNVPLDFFEAVKVALSHAETLRSTQIDIETSKLGEKDVWYRMFPKLVLSASYNFPVIQSKNTGTVYKESANVSFSTGSYDPIAAYIGHEGSKVAVKLAEVLHVIAIQDMMEKIGLAFIAINAAEEEIACRKNLVSELESLEKYTAQKLDAGTISTLEHRTVQQRLALIRLELKRTIRKQALARRSLRQMIGVGDVDTVVFDTSKILEELTDEDLQQSLRPEALMKNNLKLQAQALQQKLQIYNIRLAQAEHIPKFTFGFSTPDPMSNQSGNLPYYATIMASVPVWSWGETMRGVERQELKLVDTRIKSKLMFTKIQQSADDLQLIMDTTEEAVALAKTKVELQKLEALRKEIGYKMNSVPYDALIATREAAINGQIEAIKAQQTLNETRLDLKAVTGRLITKYVRVNYGELEKD